MERLRRLSRALSLMYPECRRWSGALWSLTLVLRAWRPPVRIAGSVVASMAYLSMTSNVSGFAIRPHIPGGWMLVRAATDPHVLEGLVAAQFHGAKTKVKAPRGFRRATSRR